MAIVITHAKSNTIPDWSGVVTVANSTGGTSTDQASNLVRPSDWNSNHSLVASSISATDMSGIYSGFNAGNGLYVSTSSNGVTFGEVADEWFEPFPMPNTNGTLSTRGNGTWYIEPFLIQGGMPNCHMNFFYVQGASSQMFQNGASFTSSVTGSVSRYMTIYNRFALYSQGTGASSTALYSYFTFDNDMNASQEIRVTTNTNSLMSISYTHALTADYSYGSDGAVATSNFSTAGSTTTTSGASSLLSALMSSAQAPFTGSVMGMAGIGTSLAAGNWWLAHMQSTTSSSTGTNYGAGTLFSTQSLLGLLEYNMVNFKQQGKSVTNSSTQAQWFKGYLATVSIDATSKIAQSDVRNLSTVAGSNFRMYWNLQQASTA